MQGVQVLPGSKRLRCTDAEPPAVLLARLLEFWDTEVLRLQPINPASSQSYHQQQLHVLVVSHGASIETLFLNGFYTKHKFDLPTVRTARRLGNTSVSMVSINTGQSKGQILLYGDLRHLGVAEVEQVENVDAA